MAGRRWEGSREPAVSCPADLCISGRKSAGEIRRGGSSGCMMGLAGEIGWRNMQPGDGNSTYRSRIIDAICNLDGDTLEKEARYELR